MPPISPSQDHLSFLVVNRDSALGKLIQMAGRKGRWNHGISSTEEQESIDHAKIVSNIRQFLEEGTARVFESSLDGRGVANAIRKVEAILRQLIKDDPTSKGDYDLLVEELAGKVDLLAKSSSSLAIGASLSVERQDDSTFKYYWQKEFQFQAKFDQLNDKQKLCLSFCFSFFSEVTSVDIKKRDLIQWWIGMDLIDDNPSDGDDMLRELVEKEFIVQSFLNRTTPSDWYSMNSSVLSNTRAAELLSYEAKQKDRLFIAHYNDDVPQQALTEPEKIAAGINISAYTLNVKTFDWLFLMKNARVIHLGSWHHNMDYVVVEDIIKKFLKALKNLKELRFLSLQGISRIEELPKSIYSLRKLKVLDLRACQDLRLIPKGIESLKQLTHLDLSQCYQLTHIPKAITSLSTLRVLKGFMINPDIDQPQLRIYRGQSPSCAFSDLPKLEQLIELTIRTKRINFPTSQDVEILCEMKKLSKLKIAWVSSKSHHVAQTPGDKLKRFPMTLKKLELQAAPQITASRLLSLISNRSDNYLEKLYVTGGGLLELDIHKYCFPGVKVVRFRHMLHLHINWQDFKHQFPNLTRVEIFGCPNFIFFPCNESGVWEK